MQLTTMTEFTRTEHVHLSKEVKEANIDIMTSYMTSLRTDGYLSILGHSMSDQHAKLTPVTDFAETC